MKHRALLIALSAATILAALGLARADEGMWLYNFPPTAQIKAKYGLELTKVWLDRTRLSSVRFDNGGSGSFVSVDGLVFTNHHIAAECVEELSNTGKDYNALPRSWLDAKSKLNLTTPLDVVQTSDIIGGNSGSPVLNTNGEVGIIFDGDAQSLPWNFAYDDTLGRAIQVDSRGILEALRHIFNASALADELSGTASSKR